MSLRPVSPAPLRPAPHAADRGGAPRGAAPAASQKARAADPPAPHCSRGAFLCGPPGESDMRMSQLFTQTQRQAPAEAEVASHQLLVRAGFLQPLAAGVFSALPLAHRSLDKIEAILRQEIDAIGGR